MTPSLAMPITHLNLPPVLAEELATTLDLPQL
jgi:hypothetical protein